MYVLNENETLQEYKNRLEKELKKKYDEILKEDEIMKFKKLSDEQQRDIFLEK